MKIPFTFRLRLDILLAVFAVVAAAAMLTGIYTYSGLMRYSRGTFRESLPQQQLFLLGSLINDIQMAENSVRAYRLSHDEQWMEQFEKHSEESFLKLSGLYDLSAGQAGEQQQLDSLSGLVQQKLEVLTDFSQVADRAAVVSELERIARKIEDAEGEKEPRRNFIQRLFSRNRRGEKQDSLMASVRQEVNHVARDQNLQLGTIDAQELDFLLRISHLTGQIETIVSQMRLQDLNQVEAMVTESARRQASANRRIQGFALMAVLFLMVGAVAVVRYISTRRQYEAALKQAREKALQYSAMQERFVANMSHEVRTPLHAIAGFSEQLGQAATPEKQREYHQLIRSAAGHLLQVVNDILDYSKLKAGSMKLRQEPFYPLQEAQVVAGIFANELHKKNLAFNLENLLVDDLPVVGDALRFRQVLVNLVGNAVKFTPQGTITLRLQRQQLPDGRLMIHVEVADTGIGMHKEQLDKIFLPFEQVENSVSRQYKGTGLGLTISRDIINQHGGEIHLKSTPGKGTRIFFSIPYEEATTQPLQEATPQQEAAFLNGLKVLVADDEEWNRHLLSNILERHHARVVMAHDGPQALEKLLEGTYDLACLDVRMPGLSGPEVVKKLSQAGARHALRVMALTALTGAHQEKSLIREGMDAVVTKPFTEQELLRGLKQLMSKPLKAAPASKKKAPRALPEPYCRQSVEGLGSGDPEFVRQMVEIFVKNASNTISQVRQALAANDLEAIAWHTHKLAPAARQIKAAHLLMLLKELEQKAGEREALPPLEALLHQMEQEARRVSATLQAEYLEV